MNLSELTREASPFSDAEWAEVRDKAERILDQPVQSAAVRLLCALLLRVMTVSEGGRTDTALLDFLEAQDQQDVIAFAPGGPTGEDTELRVAGGVYVAQTVRGAIRKAMREGR